MAEWTIQSRKTYADPFNDVDVDVIFSKEGQTWRVPAFWRGGQRWTVRFAPPAAGKYGYRLESTDPGNPDLNGHSGEVLIAAYAGRNELLRHGNLRISSNRRYFEHADGTPFYWLGDTWWTGLSDRLSWEGFQKLTADRRDKGFTLIQIVAGLVPPEEQAPLDPGYRNEGGPVWEADFRRINPRYFDYADRRILHLIDEGMVPAIVGGWNQILRQMSVGQMKKHWRYVIARYGAYPVLWVVGGELVDPPAEAVDRSKGSEYYQSLIVRGWTDVARYIRVTDPYHHPLTAHEAWPPFDSPLQDESLTDFDMIQSSHFGWASIAAEVAQLNMHYARTVVTKPIVQGEIGYEKLGESYFEDFQRTAFWLSMLNGAAGHTYGANGTWEAYTGDKPLHRSRWSFLSWEEGMNLPGSYQVGLGARLLRQYPWWRFASHPEWITPRGTTLLEPNAKVSGFDIGSLKLWEKVLSDKDDFNDSLEAEYAAGEWTARKGNFRRPYAAGIPGKVRVIYMPNFGLIQRTPPTVLGLEPGVRYHAYFWEPSSGTRMELGAVERPTPGARIFEDSFDGVARSRWGDLGADEAERSNGAVSLRSSVLCVVRGLTKLDVVVSTSARSDFPAALAMRIQNAESYVTAVYSPEEKSVFLMERQEGVDSLPLGRTPVPNMGSAIRLSAEVRGGKGVASLSDGERTFTTPIVEIGSTAAGSVGLLHRGPGAAQRYHHFEIRESPALVRDGTLPRELYDARGQHRGKLAGSDLDVFKVPGWDKFAREKHILLDAYRPERLPTSGDWLLVLEAR